MEEREEDKRCWKCENLDKEFGCNCDLTGDNVILDLSVEDTFNCEGFSEIDAYNEYISELDNKKREAIESGERLE